MDSFIQSILPTVPLGKIKETVDLDLNASGFKGKPLNKYVNLHPAIIMYLKTITQQ